MNKFMRKQYTDFLNSRLENLKIDLEGFYKDNNILRNTTFKQSSSCIQYALTLPKELIGRIKSAIVNKYITGTQEVAPAINSWLKDLEAKRGPLPPFPYNTPIQTKDRNRENIGRMRKPLNDRADTIIRAMEKQLKTVYEEIELVERLKENSE